MINIETKDKTGVYSGKVEITLLKGNKPYKVIKNHNAGTANLFKHMLRATTGESVQAKRPGLIFLYNGKTKVLDTGVLYSDVSEITITNNNEASVIFSFLVPDILVQGKTINGVKLFDISGKEEYANISFESFTVSDNTNIEIRWTLVLSNG